MDMNDFKLDSENKISSGFTTPDHYFDGLSEKLFRQLPAPQPKVLSLWDRNKKWVYATAAILALSLAIPVVDYFKADANDQYAAEVENYLTNHSNLTDEDIVELMGNEEAEATPIDNTSVENEALEDILSHNDHLEEYIIN